MCYVLDTGVAKVMVIINRKEYECVYYFDATVAVDEDDEDDDSDSADVVVVTVVVVVVVVVVFISVDGEEEDSASVFISNGTLELAGSNDAADQSM